MNFEEIKRETMIDYYTIEIEELTAALSKIRRTDPQMIKFSELLKLFQSELVKLFTL